MRHLITLADVSAAEIDRIFSIAEDLKTKYANGLREPLLPGRVMAMLFEKQSLRTRVSFESGMIQLGGSALFLGQDPVDGQYARHREATTLVGLACPQMWDTCFCTVVGGAPNGTDGLDVLLTEVDASTYAVQAFSEKGASLAQGMPGEERDVLPVCHVWEEAGALHAVADLTAEADGILGDRLVEHAHRAFVRLLNRVHQLQQRGLAGAALADDGGGSAGGQGEAHILEHRLAGQIGLPDVLEPDAVAHAAGYHAARRSPWLSRSSSSARSRPVAGSFSS